jgi:hypothetical protein
LTLADVNGDGNLDVIVTEFATGAWRILWQRCRRNLAPIDLVPSRTRRALRPELQP